MKETVKYPFYDAARRLHIVDEDSAEVVYGPRVCLREEQWKDWEALADEIRGIHDCLQGRPIETAVFSGAVLARMFELAQACRLPATGLPLTDATGAR